MRGSRAFLLLALLTFLPTGCGGSSGAETGPTEAEPFRPLRNLTVTLDGRESPENVGILMAQKLGFFADARLSVSIFSPAAPGRPVLYVSAGEDDFGVTQEPQMVLAGEKGAPVVAVASLVSQPTEALIWLKKSGIGGIGDLKGKTIGIAGVPFQEDFLSSVLARYGLTLDDVKVENLGYDLVPALAGGRVDAILGSWNLEGIELKARGLNPVVTRLEDRGVPPYEQLVVIARKDRVEKEPQLIRDFVSAVRRGVAVAVEHPRAAAGAIEEAGILDYEFGPRTTEAQVAATLPLLSKSGYMSPGQASGLIDWMGEEGLVKGRVSPSALLTNEYRGQP